MTHSQCHDGDLKHFVSEWRCSNVSIKMEAAPTPSSISVIAQTSQSQSHDGGVFVSVPFPLSMSLWRCPAVSLRMEASHSQCRMEVSVSHTCLRTCTTINARCTIREANLKTSTTNSYFHKIQINSVTLSTSKRPHC